jgi:SAM-dependent methyltransferase
MMGRSGTQHTSGDRVHGLYRFWAEHYEQVFATEAGWLDLGNERVQNQAFGLCLEAAGAVFGRCCLDLGCGRGQFARILAGCGAQVIAVDAAATIREPFPGIEWRRANLLDQALFETLPLSDLVFMLEVLQYLPIETVDWIWTRVGSGGRLVGVVPNSGCPIVQGTVERFQGNYLAQSPESLFRALTALPDVELVGIRGLTFQDDQRIVPYSASPWQFTRPAEALTPANRLQYVAIRA